MEKGMGRINFKDNVDEVLKKILGDIGETIFFNPGKSHAYYLKVCFYSRVS